MRCRLTLRIQFHSIPARYYSLSHELITTIEYCTSRTIKDIDRRLWRQASLVDAVPRTAVITAYTIIPLRHLTSCLKHVRQNSTRRNAPKTDSKLNQPQRTRKLARFYNNLNIDLDRNSGKHRRYVVGLVPGIWQASTLVTVSVRLSQHVIDVVVKKCVPSVAIEKRR